MATHCEKCHKLLCNDGQIKISCDDALKPETYLYQNISCCITINALRFHYENQMVDAVFRENHTKHADTFCGQREWFLNVTTGGKCSNHCALKLH